MTTRREFTRFGALGSGVLSASPSMAHFSWSGAAGTRTDYAVLESNLDLELDIKRALIAHASSTIEINEDVGNFWIHSLLPSLSSKATFVAGITTGHSAFVIEELARDYGHSLVHSSHDLRLAAPERIRQRLLRPTELNTARPVYWLLAAYGINFHN